MDPTNNELIVAIYVALASAAGGRELLNHSNDILREAVNSGAISRPDTRQAISTLIAATGRAA